MINVNEIKQIEGFYKSVLYKNYYAVDVLVERGGIIFRLRYPYNLQDRASQALRAMKNKQQQDIPEPDYKPCIWMVGASNQKVI